ncbi:hypothetical protein M758_8G130200 [Ceratodon purpureus]|uniref:Legume lectin domain-containing protein n=1 Tax=Ceratodon purpureus TaxID=3225 RepID=A0A8T0H6K8_CERPU|nr:hypothetical protein KC19_8G135100 [Ceratodon purpureus]KAG0608761.1 hypothetical protein M758_8G130200 [Ceratodon purpureus]
MASRNGSVLLCLVAILALLQIASTSAAETPPKGVSIAFPPLDKRFTCSVDPAIGVDTKFICTPGTSPTALVLSNDNDVVSARYQYATPVQLWKRGSKYVASFSAYFTVNFDRSSEFTVRELFSGGGLAFAITPSLSVIGTGQESFGLFPIDEKTGASKNGANTKTVAVELDISRIEPNGFDPQIPHIGLDINSVKSVKTKYLGDPATIIDSKIGVWIEYNALKKTIQVYIHKVKVDQTPKRQNANIAISYTGLDLAKEVKDFSYVGFSSRVPETPNGVYKIYDFKFSTTWVLGSTVN